MNFFSCKMTFPHVLIGVSVSEESSPLTSLKLYFLEFLSSCQHRQKLLLSICLLFMTDWSAQRDWSKESSHKNRTISRRQKISYTLIPCILTLWRPEVALSLCKPSDVTNSREGRRKYAGMDRGLHSTGEGGDGLEPLQPLFSCCSR